MSLLLGWGAYVRDKNTSARLCAKKAGGAYAQGGAYLQDTTVYVSIIYLVYSPLVFPTDLHYFPMFVSPYMIARRV